VGFIQRGHGQPLHGSRQISLTSSNTLGSLKCVAACTIAFARFSDSAGSANSVEFFMKMPEPRIPLPLRAASRATHRPESRFLPRRNSAPAACVTRHHLHQFVRRAVLLGFGVEFLFARTVRIFISITIWRMWRTAWTTSPVPASPLCESWPRLRRCAAGLAQVARAADEWNRERVLVDVMRFVGGVRTSDSSM